MSQIPKLVLTAVISAGIVGSGVYLLFAPNSQLAAQQSLTALAEKSNNEFVYLVTAPKIGGESKMILKDWNYHFSLAYSYTPWGQLRYTKTDLTASGGAPTNSFDSMISYNFCAGEQYCFLDERSGEKDGLGFTITMWNAKFSDRTSNPKFYLKNGEVFLKETDKYIITYKPFPKMDYSNVAELKKLMNTFEFESFNSPGNQ